MFSTEDQRIQTLSLGVGKACRASRPLKVCSILLATSSNDTARISHDFLTHNYHIDTCVSQQMTTLSCATRLQYVASLLVIQDLCILGKGNFLPALKWEMVKVFSFSSSRIIIVGATATAGVWLVIFY